MILIMGSQMSFYGNGSWDSVQAPLIFMLTFGWLRQRSAPSASSAHGSAGAGGLERLLQAEVVDDHVRYRGFSPPARWA